MQKNSSIILSGLTREELQEDIMNTFSKLLGRKVNSSSSSSSSSSFGGSFDGIDFDFDTVPDQKQTKQTKPNEKYLTRGEVASLLKISLPTLHRYTKDGILKSYRIVGKVRYKLDEVDNALKERNFGLPMKGGRNV